MAEYQENHQTVIASIRRPLDVATRAKRDPDDDSPFVFEAVISNMRVDTYFTRMDEQTLDNFQRGAILGVALLDSHNHRSLPVGYSRAGRIEADENGGKLVVAEFYIARGIEFGSGYSYRSSDGLIRAIESETVRDVSVGFYGGDWTCDICGRDYLEYWAENACTHVAGMTYSVPGDDGVMRNVLCTITIRGATLSEVSLVFDGATPGATIMKAERQAEAGTLTNSARLAIETRYQVRLPEGEKQMKATKREEAVATAEDVEIVAQDAQDAADVITSPEEVAAYVADALDGEPEVEADVAENENEDDGEARVYAADLLAERNRMVSRVASLVKENKTLTAEVDRLRGLADMGKAYHADLIEETIAAGIRAQGNSFPSEQYRGLLESAGIEQIKAVRDGFAAQAAERLPVGRKTIDAPTHSANGNAVPSAAYAG
jgi:hypothetical protein